MKVAHKTRNISLMRRRSSNASCPSFQQCLQSPPHNPVYCSLFEFLQNSEPRVVWRYGEMDESIEPNFMWYILSVSSIAETNNILPKPTFVTSTYNTFSYSAYYVSVPDIEARGFSRTICLVIVPKEKELTFAIRSLFYTEFSKVIDAARENSAALFMSEIDVHIETLINHLNSVEMQDEGMKTKLNRLKEIKETLGKKNLKKVPFSRKRCEENALLFINPNLRKIEFIIDFSVLQNQIMEILRSISLPRHVLMGQIFAPECCSNVYVPSLDVPEDKSMIRLADSDVLKHVLYSMLTGRTIVIVCTSIESIRPLAISLVELMPFRWENDLYAFKNPVTAEECMKYSVVIAPGLKTTSRKITVIDFDETVYSGGVCPPRSFVTRIPSVNDAEEGVFWLRLNFAINHFKERYQRFALIVLERTPKEYFDVSPTFNMHGFSKVDEEIFSFFNLAMSSDVTRPETHPNEDDYITIPF